MEEKLSSRLAKPFLTAGHSWDRFWFTPVDSFNTSVIRILAGCMLLYTHLIWGTRLDEFFSRDGWNSQAYLSSMQADTLAWSFWWYVPDAWLSPVHYACCTVVLAFALGFMTRTTSILSWLIAVAYSHRSALSNYGLDQINCILLMYLMVAPCGHYLSIDAWIRSRKHPATDPGPSILANVSMRLMQLHLCIIYLWAGLGKLQGESWWDGRAMWQAFSSYEYQSLDMTFLAGFPIVLNLLTHLTIAWEVFFCALVWNKTLRPLMLLLGFGMHMGIGAFLGMWTFGTAMTFGYLSFVNPKHVRAIVARLTRTPSLQVPRWLVATTDESQMDIENQASNHQEFAQPTPRSKNFDNLTLPQRVAAFSSANRLDADATLPPLVPFQRSEPTLILVVRSQASREKLEAYFAKHVTRLLTVDGLVEAGALARVAPEPVVVDVDSRYVESELQVLLHWIRTQNAQTRFVLVGQDPHFGSDDPGTVIVEKDCSLRQIRSAIEELTGCNLSKAEKEIKVSSPSQDHQAGYSHILPTLLLGLSLFGLLGCGPERTPALLLEKVRMLNDRQQSDQALSIIKEVLEQEPNHSVAFYLRGVAFEQQGNLEKALEAYDTCLKFDPEYPEALNNRGIVYGQMGESDKALADLKAATRANPDESLFWANLGLAYFHQGKIDDAVECYSRAIQLSDDIRNVFHQGNVFLSAGRFAEADETFTKVIERDKYYAAAYLNRAHARIQQGLWEPARQDLDAARSFDSDLTLAPHIQSLQGTIDEELFDVIQSQEIGKWLATQGWETVTAEAPFRLAAKNREGEIRNILVMHQDDAGQPVCEDILVDAALSTERPLMLLVVDAVVPRTEGYVGLEKPAWVVQFADAWRPQASDFAPAVFRLVSPKAEPDTVANR